MLIDNGQQFCVYVARNANCHLNVCVLHLLCGATAGDFKASQRKERERKSVTRAQTFYLDNIFIRSFIHSFTFERVESFG